MSCASHAHVGDLPGDNAAQNALYSCPVRPFILLQYHVTQTNVTCQWPTGRSPCYGAKRPSVPSSADIICLRKNLWPAYKSNPPILRGKTVTNFSTCTRVHTVGFSHWILSWWLCKNQVYSQYKHSLTFRVCRSALCYHSNEIRAPTANPPKSTQLRAPPSMPQVTSGSMQWCGNAVSNRHKDACDQYTFRLGYASREM